MASGLTIEPADRPSSLAGGALASLAPLAAALAYPLLLAAYHAAAARLPGQPWTVVLLVPAFAVPPVAFAGAARSFRLRRPTVRDLRLRALCLAAVAAPPLYVFLGVVQGLLAIPVADVWTWAAAWIGLGLWASAGAGSTPEPLRVPRSARLRVAHGLAASLLLLFVAFHLANHLLAIYGPGLHAAVMHAGRAVYRSPLVEPVLAGLFLFQAASGMVLLRRAARSAAPPIRVFQLASGAYLGAYVLCHMDSVFVAARLVRHVETDWAFAAGAPTGLLADAWNVRLLPHYAFAAFLALGHLASGLRQVTLAHGLASRLADRLWAYAIVASAIVAALIAAVLCGLRVS